MDKAITLLQKATTAHGILASPVKQENYQRVWSRDGIMAGIAGILIDDSVIIQGLKETCLTLARNQHPKGTIPSNVPLDRKAPSYGSLVGRVDATSWFVIGSCLYYLNTKDHDFWKEIESNVNDALAILDAWEFNDRHLIYTPLSGNWADEYPMHGYLLYDNLLRLWAVQLFAKISTEDKYLLKAKLIKQVIQHNFFFDQQDETRYHPTLYHRAYNNHWKIPVAGFNPSRYYKIFDACGIGLALLMNVSESKQTAHNVTEYLNKMKFNESEALLVPAFWPVIKEEESLWDELAENYSYSFKNTPHHFHNGGIWPIMSGWLALGLKSQGQSDAAERIFSGLEGLLAQDDYQFSEYYDSLDLKANGKKPLSYSATGYIFTKIASSDTSLDKLYLS